MCIYIYIYIYMYLIFLSLSLSLSLSLYVYIYIYPNALPGALGKMSVENLGRPGFSPLAVSFVFILYYSILCYSIV